jgi:hypothetical protein
LRSFERHGVAYVELARPWLEGIGLGLTPWQGSYEGSEETWLRWCDRAGEVLPTGAESAAQERKRAERERERAERLLARLRALGVEPNGD